MTKENDNSPCDSTAADSYFENNPSHADNVDAGGSITHMDELASYEIAAGLFFRPVFAKNISLNFVSFPPDSGFPSHVHPEEQVSIVREGEMEVTVGTLTRMVKPGDVIVFPSNVPHAGRTFDGPCRLIDIFSPPRTGIRDVIAHANPVRAAEVDRWWYDERESDA